MPDLQLIIDGTRYGGWKSVRVTRSIESIADTFDLSVTERWPGSLKRRSIRAGDACELRYGDERVLTGYVDDVIPNYNATQHSLTVAGRSKLGDAVDCSILGDREFNDRGLAEIARSVLSPFGIDVEVKADLGDKFQQEGADRPESAFAFLKKLARKRGVLLVSDRAGNLVITRAGTERAHDAIELGKNVLQASGHHSFRDRYAEIVVLGQGRPGDFGSAEKTAHNNAKATDPGVTRYRPKVFKADGPSTIADCRDRAAWERNTRYGRSQGTVYTVHGWTQSNGVLWEPNRLVPVKDAYQQIDLDLLIASVQYILDQDGTRTELRVLPKEAYDMEPLPDENAAPIDPLAVR